MKKQVCVYRNENFERKTSQQVDQAQAFAQRLVDSFNGLGFDPLKESEFQILLTNPRAVFDSRIATVETPENMNRQKYLELMDLPSIDPLLAEQRELLKNPFSLNSDLLFLTGKTVSINLPQLEMLQTSQNVYVAEKSKEHKEALKIQTLVEVVNNISKYDQRVIDPSPRNPLSAIIDFREIEAPGKYSAIISREKLLDYLNKIQQ